MQRSPSSRPIVALLGAVLMLGVLAGCSSSGAGTTSPSAVTSSAAVADAEDEFDGWPQASPKDLGFKGQRLEALARRAKAARSTCFAVLRRGKLVRDWNWEQDRDTPREVFSVTKSVASALVGIAEADGDLELDDTVARYVPAWRGTASAAVTIRDLLSNDSGRFWSSESDYGDLVQSPNRTRYAIGLEQQHPPDTAWAYNNAAIQVLDAVLSRATGQRADEFAAERLFEPLGMTHTRLTRDSSGRSTNVFFGMQTTCLDLARFGQLFLDKGTVDDRRILPRSFVSAAVGRSSTDLNSAYGYLWWLNRTGTVRGALDAIDPDGQPLEPRTGQLMPGAPADVFAAMGLGGQTLLVDPGSRTLVVRLGVLAGGDGPAYGFGDAAEVITSALR